MHKSNNMFPVHEKNALWNLKVCNKYLNIISQVIGKFIESFSGGKGQLCGLKEQMYV